MVAALILQPCVGADEIWPVIGAPVDLGFAAHHDEERAAHFITRVFRDSRGIAAANGGSESGRRPAWHRHSRELGIASLMVMTSAKRAIAADTTGVADALGTSIVNAARWYYEKVQ